MEFTEEEAEEIERHGLAALQRMAASMKMPVEWSTESEGMARGDITDNETICSFKVRRVIQDTINGYKMQLGMEHGIAGRELLNCIVRGLALALAQSQAFLEKVDEVKARPHKAAPVDHAVDALKYLLTNNKKPTGKKPGKKKGGLD